MGLNLKASAEQIPAFKARAEEAAECQGDGSELLLVSLLLDSWHPDQRDVPADVADLGGCGAYWLMAGEPYRGAAVDYASFWARYAALLGPSPTRTSAGFDEERVRQLATLGNRAAIEVDWLAERLGCERSSSFGYSQLKAIRDGELPSRRRASTLAG